MKSHILLGDCYEQLKTLPDESVDSVVSDPPYGLGTREPTGDEIVAYLQGAELRQGGDFMGRQWDVPSVAVWKECFRVLKPGGHLLSFGGTRTFDLISIGIRAAGFECRDTVASQFSAMCLQWIQGQGFPKSANIRKQLEKMGLSPAEAELWEGWGTALKPSWEPVLVFRKPVAESTVAKQVLKTGTGAMNIDACRVGVGGQRAWNAPRDMGYHGGSDAGAEDSALYNQTQGRWPANLIMTHALGCKLVGTAKVKAPVINRFDDGAKPFGGGAGHEFTSTQTGDAEGNESVSVYDCEDGCPVDALDTQAGTRKTSGGALNRSGIGFQGGSDGNETFIPPSEGTASRFFQNFECEPGCPVKELDEQSGELRARGNIGASKGGGGMYGHGLTTNEFGAGDSGGASRFFQNFTHECEDGCPVKALDEQSGHQVSGTAYEPQGRKMNRSIYGETNTLGRVLGYADEGGASRYFQSFDCVDGCPVKALDELSGERGVSGSAKKGVPTAAPSENGFLRNDGNGKYVPIHTYANDSGGASRYFQNFAYECEPGCPVKLLDDQSGITKSVGGRTGNITGSLYHDLGTKSGKTADEARVDPGFGDVGGASRYFQNFEYECAEGCPVQQLDGQSGLSKPDRRGGRRTQSAQPHQQTYNGGDWQGGQTGSTFVDESPAGASRLFGQFQPEAPFFYATKVSKAERDRGLPKGTNNHPTLKPLKLMRWLVKLVTPKGGIVLDPFCGSGTTCVAALEEGCGFIGIERDPEFHKIALMRVEAATPKRDIFDDLEDL